MILYPNVKLNLGLGVLRKREDGFHDIETLFIPYEGICDTLEIVESERFDISIEMKGGAGWNPLEDLTVKAYRMLDEAYGLPPVKIRLKKNAPVGAGLGGGSSDAVAALKILNVLFGLELSQKELLGFAGRLGSDCAFFVRNTPMIGEGRGEILSPYDIDLSPYKIRVVVPEGVSVNTAEAYRGIVPRDRDTGCSLLPLREALARPVKEWKDVLVNDFEKTVFVAHPEIAAVKEEMYEDGAVFAAMSGSGSSVFGLFENRDL